MNKQFAQIPKGKHIYIASDFHLGSPNKEESLLREKKIVSWLSQIEKDATGIILAGDIFDFWFEYKTVVPKGFTRLLGKLASLSDAGIPIIIFSGNHDLWIKDYLIDEINAHIYHQPESFQVGDIKILIGHGDGLGPGDNKFKFFKKIFTFSLNQWLFRWLHPDIGIRLANAWSARSQKKCMEKPDPFLGDKEPLFIHCQEIEQKDHHDYYFFGHRHIQYEAELAKNAKYINLGDWIRYFTYGKISSTSVDILKFEN